MFHDVDLAQELAEVERTIHPGSPEAILDWARIGLIGAVQSRIVGGAWSRPKA